MEQKILPDGTVHTSATFDEISELKRQIFPNRPYADRTSIGFAFQMNAVVAAFGTYRYIIDELDALEGLSGQTNTKQPTQFTKKPLRPFWHKHFTTPKHLINNSYAHWGLLRAAQNGEPIDPEQKTRFDKMCSEVARDFGDDPDKWPAVLAHRFVMEGYENRSSSRKLTGDWIVFAKHEGENYYLDIASHKVKDTVLFEQIRNGSMAEFPFLFEE